MSHKTVSAALTVVLLFLAGVVVLFAEIIALNGFSERQGIAALVTSLICQGAGIILAAVVAGRLSAWLMAKFDWNMVLSVVVAVLAGTLLGGGMAAISVILSLAIAQGMR